MINIVYLTINTVNRKIYIGVHETEDDSKFDFYLGNGVFSNKAINNPKTPFQEAVKKYGVKAFERITLFRCQTRQEALDIESILVNEEFIKRKDTYNITLGGGMPPILNVNIYKYSLDGTYLSEYLSVKDASIDVGAKFSGCISQAAICKTISFGYLWSYHKIDRLNLEEFKINIQKVSVHVYNSDREYVRSFDMITECAEYFGIEKYSTISNALYSGKKINGYYFSNMLCDILPIIKQLDNTCTIYQYDIDGNYLKSFKNIKELKSIYTFTKDKLETAIYQSKPMLDFRWSLEKCDKILELNDYMITNKGRKIGQYTKEGELIQVFNTVREARKDFTNVSKVLSGKAAHCKGFVFKYIE